MTRLADDSPTCPSQSSYILFGVIAGGIYFEEFSEISKGALGEAGWAFFAGGLLAIMGGLYLIAPQVSTDEPLTDELLPAVPEDRSLRERSLQHEALASFGRAIPITGVGLPGAAYTRRESDADSESSYVTARTWSSSVESRSRTRTDSSNALVLGPRARSISSSANSPRAQSQTYAVEAPLPDNAQALLADERSYARSCSIC